MYETSRVIYCYFNTAVYVSQYTSTRQLSISVFCIKHVIFIGGDWFRYIS